MNDNPELDPLLKSARTPERGAEYWDTFPRKVTAKLHWLSQSAGARSVSPANRRVWSGLRWGLAAACVAGLVAIGIHMAHQPGRSDDKLAEARIVYREIESLFPNQIRAIELEQQGPRVVLADRADVPHSAPYYVRVCAKNNCRNFVTFSGQCIQFNGESLEVLADGRGGVLLVGRDRVWTEDESGGKYRIQAHSLAATM